MEQLNLQKSRRMAENWLDDHRRAAVASASEDERRLLETLYARQKGSMEYLGLIRLDMGQHADEEERELPMALTIPAHPAVCLLLSAVQYSMQPPVKLSTMPSMMVCR